MNAQPLPEETIEVLQTYHEEMGKLINAHGAGIEQPLVIP